MDLVKHSDVKPSKVKGCKYCGKEFVKKHRNHLFCSKNCARENYKTHHSTYQPKNEISIKHASFAKINSKQRFSIKSIALMTVENSIVKF